MHYKTDIEAVSVSECSMSVSVGQLCSIRTLNAVSVEEIGKAVSVGECSMSVNAVMQYQSDSDAVSELF